MVYFIQTLSRKLCAVAISRVSFLDLFGLIAGGINPIICNYFSDETKCTVRS